MVKDQTSDEKNAKLPKEFCRIKIKLSKVEDDKYAIEFSRE